MEPADRLQEDLFWENFVDIKNTVQQRVIDRVTAQEFPHLPEGKIRILAYFTAEMAYEVFSKKALKLDGKSPDEKKRYIKNAERDFTSLVSFFYEKLVETLMKKQEIFSQKYIHVLPISIEKDS